DWPTLVYNVLQSRLGRKYLSGRRLDGVRGSVHRIGDLKCDINRTACGNGGIAASIGRGVYQIMQRHAPAPISHLIVVTSFGLPYRAPLARTVPALSGAVPLNPNQALV